MHVWVRSPTAHLWQSRKIAITINDPGVPNPQALAHVLKASWLHKTAQIFANCQFPVISLTCLVVLWNSVGALPADKREEGVYEIII